MVIGLPITLRSNTPGPPSSCFWARRLFLEQSRLPLARLWARFVSPPKPGLQKNATYECGLEAKGDAWVQLDVSYYLYAIVFLIFDVEAVFLLPFAAAFSGLSLAACLAMLVFLLLLVEGLSLGLPKGRVDVELMRVSMDQDLKTELSKHGIFATSL